MYIFTYLTSMLVVLCAGIWMVDILLEILTSLQNAFNSYRSMIYIVWVLVCNPFSLFPFCSAVLGWIVLKKLWTSNSSLQKQFLKPKKSFICGIMKKRKNLNHSVHEWCIASFLIYKRLRINQTKTKLPKGDWCCIWNMTLPISSMQEIYKLFYLRKYM